MKLYEYRIEHYQQDDRTALRTFLSRVTSWSQGGVDHLLRLVTGLNSHVLLMKADERVIGYAHITRIHPFKVEFSHVAVLQNFRKQGVSSGLFYAALDYVGQVEIHAAIRYDAHHRGEMERSGFIVDYPEGATLHMKRPMRL
jgi:predicted GNAT family acetyltransferase